MSVIDRAGSVRRGEELDGAAVDTFLKSRIPDLSGTPDITQFKGGVSNLTYQITYPERSVILRRPPFGNRSGAAHDVLREARVMAALRPVYPYVPGILAIQESPDVIGCPFYVMERFEGIIPRRDLPAGLALSPEDTRRLCLGVIDRLIELHRVDYRAAGLETLGRGAGYVRRQVEGWCGRYHNARTEDAAGFAGVMDWLLEKMPAGDAATTIIHNDYRFDNVVLDPANPFRVIGVLDWEMATLGDPLMDLANGLAYWVQADDDPEFLAARRQPTHLPGMLTRAEVVDYYARQTGLSTARMDFYMVFGLFRLAVIVQQIYQRHRQGHTANPEFASFGRIVSYLERRCLRQIGQSAL
ncbi:MAG: phosphotransferase family protein [Telmatospirillum sp.]|nr:phosphotransferase family protein [Telmatospirillum sp.]